MLIVRPNYRPRSIMTTGFLLASLALSATGRTQEPTSSAQPSAVSGTYAYDIPLFRDEMPFMNPSNTWTYFFEVRPGVRLVDGGFVELIYTTSSTLLRGQGSITVLMNNVPLASRRLGEGPNTPWKVSIPVERFRQGFNELRIVSRQRSLDGPCQDLDNLSNWVRLSKQSKLHLVREDRSVFPIASYPFPYLDTLEPNPVRAEVILPPQPTDKAISEMLELASDWGRKETVRSLSMKVRTAEVPGPAILLGNSPSWRVGDAASLGEGAGFLRNFNPTGQRSGYRMLVTGSTDAGVSRARETLAYADMVEQISGTSARIDSDPAPEPARSTTKLGVFTLADLGLPAITLSGAFHQRTTLTVLRPIRADLGKESIIKFKVRHSQTLNPLRSILTVLLNGTPIGSLRLDDGNANDGILTARIPVEELAKSRWVLEFAAYHDLAAVDCSKAYDDVAWTVIQGDSTIELVPGSLAGRPYLDAFPYLVNKEGRPPERTVMSLSGTPSSTMLSVASTISARAAQVNRTPLNWEARTAALPQSNSSSIAIGFFNEAQRFAPIADKLLVAPTANGGFKVDPKVRLVQSALDGSTIVQAVRSPWDNNSVLYVVLASDDQALSRFSQVLNNPEKAAQMTGEIVIVTREGRVVTPSTVTDREIRAEVDKERARYTATMKLLNGGIWAALGAALVLFVFQFIRKPRAN